MIPAKVIHLGKWPDSVREENFQTAEVTDQLGLFFVVIAETP